jgi:hypothetical protein
MVKNSLKKTLDSKKTAAALAAAASPRGPKVHANGQGGAKKDGRIMIGGHFHPSVYKEFKKLAIDQDKTALSLLSDAIDLLFAQHGLSTVAKLSASAE